MSAKERLHHLGIFIPGLEGHADKALSFWAPVFGWGAYENRRFVAQQSATPEEREARTRQVLGLLAHLQETEKGVMLFQSAWYKENRETAFRFFSQVQNVLSGRKIRWNAVDLGNGVKGFLW